MLHESYHLGPAIHRHCLTWPWLVHNHTVQQLIMTSVDINKAHGCAKINAALKTICSSSNQFSRSTAPRNNFLWAPLEEPVTNARNTTNYPVKKTVQGLGWHLGVCPEQIDISVELFLSASGTFLQGIQPDSQRLQNLM